MNPTVRIGPRTVGRGHPTFIVAEIGINHNGQVDLAKKLVDVAARAGCDAVKFQKRSPEHCVPIELMNVMRETPWGYITYLEYRYRVEFGYDEYREIDAHCQRQGLSWFASCWDAPSIAFLEAFDPPCYKIPSAALTDLRLLQHYRRTGRPLILSTGMSTMPEIRAAVELLGQDRLVLLHSTSTYPCPPEELNLKVIPALEAAFDVPIGYSGHEVGLVPSTLAVALGACLVERHITLDRSMWGSDHAASIEPTGLERLVKYIRTTESALGDGIKRVYESERAAIRRLRKSPDSERVPGELQPEMVGASSTPTIENTAEN
ncbi:MAG TPA: N-acetylneuraminate synthase family protein [Terriglobales bacterium]|nr:N-acetylneuraminate synthase family protein [Terriglobales bacterium]